MPLDFGSLGRRSSDSAIEPRDIYNRSRRPWSHLRHEQGEVLERWFARRDEHDLVVRQNTGGGKTAVGLLICQSSILELRLPAAYLAGDRYLVAQAEEEASRLGFAVTEDPRDTDFLNSEAILLGTWHKLINGRSQFGVAGSTRDIIDLGCVVVDDAHAALTAVEGQFRIVLDHKHEAYVALLALFAAELKAQSPNRWRELEEHDPGVTLRVPYWAWRRMHESVLGILHPHRSGDDLQFTWPLLVDDLSLCEVTFTSRSVEVRPLCPPISRIPSFAQARRRVYLTATLADDSVLVTALDADPKTIARPVAPGRAADLGDRMILAPAELNPQLADLAVRDLAAELSKTVNVVVLVPSDKAGANWTSYGSTVTPVAALVDIVRRLKGGEHLGLVVLANKYDGIDLPHDACRVLVLDGLPRALGPADRREASVLHRSPVLAARQVQRVEQGMGRGVRDASDHCVVLLIGDDLNRLVTLRANRHLFSPATAAQLDLSHEVASQIAREGIDGVRAAIDACLSREEGWVAAARDALADTTYAELQEPRSTAVAQRRGFNLATRGQHARAAEALAVAANEAASAGDDALAGVLLEQQALYLDHVDAAGAHAVQQRALVHNPLLLRPAGGVAVRLTRPVTSQAEAARKYLGELYGDDALQLVLGVREVLNRITWDPERTDDAEAAFCDLGLHLGLVSTRPDAEHGQGPDNLWAWSGHAAVIELKTGSKAEAVSKDDLDQLGGSLRWYLVQSNAQPDATPVLVHRSNLHDRNSTPPDGTRVLTERRVEGLKVAVLGWATGLAEGVGRWHESAQVIEQLKQHKLNAGVLLQSYTDAIKQAGPSGAS